MKHQAFRYDFTGKELRYFLFGSKKCPRCGGTMTREKCYETVDGQVFNSGSDPFFIQNAKVKHFYYVYQCAQCGGAFKLQELAK